jgi:hypothetical protein
MYAIGAKRKLLFKTFYRTDNYYKKRGNNYLWLKMVNIENTPLMCKMN